jgi:hypothetical protein
MTSQTGRPAKPEQVPLPQGKAIRALFMMVAVALASVLAPPVTRPAS